MCVFLGEQKASNPFFNNLIIKSLSQLLLVQKLKKWVVKSKPILCHELKINEDDSTLSFL